MSPRMEDVVSQALECEGVYLAKKDFYKTVLRGMVFMITILAAGVGTLITCNSKSVAQMATYDEATKGLKDDQDNTDVCIERLDGIIVEHAKALESLKVSTIRMSKQIDRLEGKVDLSVGTLNAILTEVRKP